MLEACQAIGVTAALGEPGEHSLPASTPITGDVLFSIAPTTPEQADHAIAAAAATFTAWRSTPAPVRGALVARLGELLTAHQQDLATLVTVEVGKITAEARGEVQEMIDVCQFSVGLSRQLYGRTIASERAGHRLLETWHPLGVVGVITAFNFPVAVWAWNTAVALVCGDTVVWKPSELTPLTALASQALLSRAAADVGAPAAVGGLLLGGAERGAQLVDDPRVALLSATGSVRMGQQVGPRVARRFGRVLLELGGNNAAIVAPEFCDHESFYDGSGRVGVGMWTGSGRRDIDEASGQSGVEKEDFRSIDDPLGKVGRPRGYAVDEIQGLEEVEVRRQGTYGDFGVGS